MVYGFRLRVRLTAAAIGIALVAGATRVDARRAPACAWSPITDVPAACRAGAIEGVGGHLACIVDECASLEKALLLSPVDERTVYPRAVWGTSDMAPHYPVEARIGLYRVLGVSHR
jgi:hypothetical protein